MAAALLTAALTLGCGSSPKPLTRVQLVEKANSICRRVATKLETVSKGENANTPQGIARVAGKLASVEQSALSELGKLVPPSALEADWKGFLAGAQSLAEDTATLSETTTTSNPAVTRRTLNSVEATQRQLAAIAKRIGLKDCEQVP